MEEEIEQTQPTMNQENSSRVEEVVKEPQQIVHQESSSKIELDSKIFAALSYFSILFVVPLIVKKEDDFVKFHIRQGITLFFAEIIVWFILYLIESLLVTLFSYSAFSFVAFLYKIAWIFFAAISIGGIYFVIRGKKRKIPVLWALSKNIKL